MKKRLLAMILALCLVIGLLPMTALAADGDVTIALAGTTGTLASDSLSISWTASGYTYLCEKNSSTTAIRTSDSDHFRNYQGTKITISGGSMSSVAITATESKYATVLKDCTVSSGWSATVNGNVVTFTTATPATELVIDSSAQWRCKTVVITPAAAGSTDCDHGSLLCGDTCPECEEYVKEHVFANNCAATCKNCTEPNPNYADHVYDGTYDATCNVCGGEREVNFPAADSVLTITEADTIGLGMSHNTTTTDKYYVTGQVESIVNTTYGNLYIQDENGNKLYIYGTYSADGSTRFDAMAEKPEVGMTITVYGVIGNYSSAAQMKNGWITEMTGGCDHDTYVEGAKAATCTEAGYTGDTKCTKCDWVELGTAIPAGHNYADGKCTACGVAQPTMVGLTVTSLGLAANSYTAGTATVDGVDFEWIQLGNYGDGIQVRDKNGNTSTLWNTAAFPGAITKIELTYSATKETKDNDNAVIFTFGNAADNLTYETKLSTVAGEKSYTITPDAATYTYFKMEHDLGYTFYWDSIVVYYEVAAAEPVPGESAENPIQLGEMGDTDLVWNDDHTEATFNVNVPAGQTYHLLLAPNACGLAMSDNGGAAQIMSQNDRYGCKFTLTEGEHVLVFTIPSGTMDNPDVIDEFAYTYTTTTVSEGDQDGYYYTYTAPAAGIVTLYFVDVPAVESGETDEYGDPVYDKYLCDIVVMKGYRQVTLLQDGVDNYGLELQIPVAEGDELLIQIIAVQDTDGNYYPEAEMTWCGNFAYPAGSEQNPIYIEWNWDDEYANATATVTVEADGTYFNGYEGMILTANGAEVAQEMGMFVLNAGTYELKLATPVGAYNNPEVIENIDGYTDTNSLEEDAAYYYIWTATEDGTVILNVTEGANLVVDKLTYVEDSEWPISTQYELAEPEIDENWNYVGWIVNDQLQISVKAGEQLKIQAQGLTDWSTWTTPAIEYTMTGEFYKEVPFMRMSLENSLTATFAFPKSWISGTGNKVVINGVEILQGAWNSTKISNVDYYMVDYTGLAAKQMVDALNVVVYDANGEIVAMTSRSVVDYAISAFNTASAKGNHTVEEAKALYVDLLTYGAAAQTKFGYKTDDLATDYLTDEMKEFQHKNNIDLSTKVAATGDAKVARAQLENQILLDIAFDGKYATGYTAEYSFTDYNGKVQTGTAVITKSGSYAVATVDKAVVADCGVVITVNIKDASGAIVATGSDSVGNWATRDQSDLAMAIMQFSASAYAYLTK